MLNRMELLKKVKKVIVVLEDCSVSEAKSVLASVGNIVHSEDFEDYCQVEEPRIPLPNEMDVPDNGRGECSTDDARRI